ncbi:hypothetical protein IFM89_024194 [Coptis chinensis]|uniref:Myb/SANT-like domain-containing protein n=1 Tax=Coptis chinensis TaxID=261450 RepID=A0A835HH72_9MAGN|nr:hypothetical protein IFM89_024194 [Coptis chinensis]
METILVEVLLEELANGGRRADNGWRKESLKRTTDEINSRLGMNLVSDNVRSRLKAMKDAWVVAKHVVDASGFGLTFNKETKRIYADDNAWESYIKAHPGASSLKQKMFPFCDECCILFRNDHATGEGGNTGFDDMETDSGGGGGDAPEVAESEANGAATSQTESAQNTTTPTAKKSRKSRFFEDIPEPPLFKVFTDAVVELAKALKPPEPVPVVVAPKPIELLKDALHSLPDMNPELYLRSLDLLAVDLPLMEVFLGLEEDIKAAWLFRKLHQAGGAGDAMVWCVVGGASCVCVAGGAAVCVALCVVCCKWCCCVCVCVLQWCGVSGASDAVVWVLLLLGVSGAGDAVVWVLLLLCVEVELSESTNDAYPHAPTLDGKSEPIAQYPSLLSRRPLDSRHNPDLQKLKENIG